jgi:hypothetical protein
MGYVTVTGATQIRRLYIIHLVFFLNENYTLSMFPNIEFNDSAFKHGITELNICYALWHPLYEELMSGYENKWLVIGYDTTGNVIEILYNIIDEDTVNIFHAMKCRNSFIMQLEI